MYPLSQPAYFWAQLYCTDISHMYQTYAHKESEFGCMDKEDYSITTLYHRHSMLTIQLNHIHSDIFISDSNFYYIDMCTRV